MESRIKSHFEEALINLECFLKDETQISNILKAAHSCIQTIQNNGKIITCGNGGSHCDAMHFAEELTGRYRNDRPGIPAISIGDSSHITCVGNDFGYDHVFGRYIDAVGSNGDVLIVISTSGNSINVINAILAARNKGLTVIGLSGKDGGKMSTLLDIEIRAPHSTYADRAQEIHIKIIHALIDAIEVGLGYSS
jgi:D-sedoheptulose 7-phosphate isomerase